MSELIRSRELAEKLAYTEAPYREIGALALSFESPNMKRVAKFALRVANQETADMARDFVPSVAPEEARVLDEFLSNNSTESLSVEPISLINNLRSFAIESHVPMARKATDNIKGYTTTMALIKSNRPKFHEVHMARFGSSPDMSDDAIDEIIDELARGWFEGESTVIELNDEGLTNTPEILRRNQTIRLVQSLFDNVRGMYSLARISSEASDTPALSEIHSDDKQALFNGLYAEWSEYMLLTQKSTVNTLGNESRTPLLYNDVSKFKSYIDEGIVPVSELITLFNYRSRRFDECYRLARDSHQAPGEQPKRRPSVREKELNRRANSVLGQENLKNFASNRQTDNILEVEDISQVDNAVFAVCAQLALEAEEKYGAPQENIWAGGISKKIGQTMRPDGLMSQLDNIRLVHLPISDEIISEILKFADLPEEIDLDSFDRIGIFADMHSRGRRLTGKTFKEVIAYTREAADSVKRKIALNVVGGTSDENTAKSILRASSVVATSVQAKNLKTPFSGGLPSLGKRR